MERPWCTQPWLRFMGLKASNTSGSRPGVVAIRLSTHPSLNHLSVLHSLCIPLSTHPRTQPPSHLPISVARPQFRPLTYHLSIYPSAHPSTQRSPIHPPICSSTRCPTLFLTHPFMQPPEHSFISLTSHLSVLFISSFISSSICPPFRISNCLAAPP